MLELPEVITLAEQARHTLIGKKIEHVANATKPHKFAFFEGDPLQYGKILTGRIIEDAKGYGMYLDLFLSGGAIISIGDGVIPRFGKPGDKIPDNYQLLLGFDDDSFLSFSIAMYGFIMVYPDGVIENEYHKKSVASISPLSNEYTEKLFNKLFEEAPKALSAKGILATHQRIPGLGNGVLQDILFNARIHPKRKALSLSPEDRATLFRSVKETLKEMTEKGGRDTQTDMFGKNGGYSCILSSKTCKDPCPVCKGAITKEAYMGGSVYYCVSCQKL